jgi:hypothetical protein
MQLIHFVPTALGFFVLYCQLQIVQAGGGGCLFFVWEVVPRFRENKKTRHNISNH